MTNFRKVGERLLPHEVNHIRINPSMDIVALALSNSDIAINRLFSWQRVWSISKPKIPSNDSGEIIKIIDMVWSIDGKILAVAYNRPIDCENRSKKNSDLDSQTATKPEYVSSIVLYLIESNQRVCVHNLEYQINCLCWQVKSYCPDSESSTTMKAINIDDIKLPLDSINIPYVDLCICDEELLNYPFNVTTSGKSSVKSTGGGTYQSETNRNKKFSSNLPPLTRLNRQDEFVSYDRMNLLQNKSINILTVGTEQNSILFYLFGYYQILNIDLKQFKIQNDNQRLNHNQDNGGDGKCQSQLMLFETKLLGNLWKEIFLVNRIRLNIDLRMDNLRDKINEICSIWSDVIADIKSRLSNYQLVLNLERFLNDLNRKETSKLYHSFEQCLDDIYRLIITNLLNTLTQILSYLDNLRGMALNDFLFGDLGISIDNVNEFRREILWMMDKCNQLMTTLDNLKCKILAITRLIYKGIFMSQYSMEQQNEFEYSKYCDDHLLDIGPNNASTISIFRFHQPIHRDNHFDLLQFNLIGNCYQKEDSTTIYSNRWH
uniref:Anaphase-promoting complex subunit 4 n=1 Tax=Dermatophagoides pteronyssinus TaxID=6956 RepID=A0A6P6XQ32_DERPT|nr:anaphase-promoting complex subunit 4-like [Dermatophagoides pteronyssinus]